MSDHDDLFEFEDFDDSDLELDLDDLFGDLATLAIDTDAPDLGQAPAATPAEPAAEVPAEPQPAPAAPPVQPVAAPPVQHVTPAAQPVAAAQPAAVPAAGQVAGQVAGIDPATLQPRPRMQVSKVGLAVGAAVVVTAANLAAMAIPHLGSAPDGPTRPVVGPVDPGPTGPDPIEPRQPEPSAEHAALLARIAQLEAEVQRQGSPTGGITPSRGDHLRVIDEARAMIARGDHVGARKRLYSLLAIVDRLPSHERDRNEALASYLLADTYKLEAQASVEEAGL